MVRIHDKHIVTLNTGIGMAKQYASTKEAEKEITSVESVAFESKPAIAPKGQKEMPFAAVKFFFTALPSKNGIPACQV